MTEVTEVYVAPASPRTAALDNAGQLPLSWAAIFAGGITAAALTLVLLAFGSGLGFSSVSPWMNSGVSAGTFKVASGIYLLIVAMLSSTIGGYIAGRFRTRWVGLHSEEVLFRDTAHGFLAWALATVFGAAVLGAAATFLVGGAAAGNSGSNAPAGNQSATAPDAYYVDMLFRPAGRTAQTSAASTTEARREARVILTRDTANGFEVPAADRTYLAQLVSAHAGLPAADAEKRVGNVITQAKAAADKTRHDAAALSFWLTAAMLLGAFAASLAAIEGGQLRDGRWKPVIGGRNYRPDALT